jgi:hypothetical protein
MAYEYKDFPVVAHVDGQHLQQDIDMYIEQHRQSGWEYQGATSSQSTDPNAGTIVLKFRREKATQSK